MPSRHAGSAVPIVVGATGHRDLVPGEVEDIRAQVVSFINQLRQVAPNTPLLFMTGLADGADQLVVDVAVNLGCEVINVLPMPLSIYLEDFDEKGRADLTRYVEQYETIELPIREGFGSGEQHRDLQYAQMGVFLAAHCHVLLAIWDGKHNGATGGTSQVIEFHQRDTTVLAGASQERSGLDLSDDESDLVFHIACTRTSSGAPVDGLVPAQSAWLTRDDRELRTREIPTRYTRVFRHLDRFNLDLQEVSADTRIELLAPVDVPAQAKRCCEKIQDLFGRCDHLAGQYQNYTLKALRTSLLSALAAGVSFVAYADLEGFGLAIYGYLIFMALAFGVFFLAERSDWQRRYIDYRVLTEGLRVQYYWALAGVEMDNPTRFGHDQLFYGRHLDMGWIRNVMRYTGIRSDANEEADAEGVLAAIEFWIGDSKSGQLGYYSARSRRRLDQHRSTTRITRLCFLAGIVAAAVLAISRDSGFAGLETILIAAMGMLPLIAAGRQTYAHRVAERELVAQYAQMHTVFRHAHRLLAVWSNDRVSAQNDIATVNYARKVLLELGEAALNENAQWVLRQRERPLPGGESLG